jgi:hypothetical protein
MPRLARVTISKLAVGAVESLHEIAPQLDSVDTGFSDVEVAARFVSSVMPRCERLAKLRMYYADGVGCAALQHRSLRTLLVHECDGAQLREAAKLKPGMVAPLVELDLGGSHRTSFDDDAVIRLCDSGHLAHVRALRLGSKDLTEAGIAAAMQLPALEELAISDATIASTAEITKRAPTATLRLFRVSASRKVKEALEAHWRGLLTP